jgi:hypothetical protein
MRNNANIPKHKKKNLVAFKTYFEQKMCTVSWQHWWYTVAKKFHSDTFHLVRVIIIRAFNRTQQKPAALRYGWESFKLPRGKFINPATRTKQQPANFTAELKGFGDFLPAVYLTFVAAFSLFLPFSLSPFLQPNTDSSYIHRSTWLRTAEYWSADIYPTFSWQGQWHFS